jgi:ankyrin repeat protein
MSQQFFEAIRAGDRGKVETLLVADSGLLAAKDEKGLGAYTAAKYSGRNEIAALLLERGVELDVFAACMAGARERVVELIGGEPELIQANSHKAYSHDGWTALHLACFFGHATLAEMLIAQGAEVNGRSRNGMQNTPLHAAAAGRNRDAVRGFWNTARMSTRGRRADGRRCTRRRKMGTRRWCGCSSRAVRTCGLELKTSRTRWIWR